MSEIKKVKSPIDTDTLTKDKVYDVLWVGTLTQPSGWDFKIISDSGSKIYCLQNGCTHLNGKDWIVVE